MGTFSNVGEALPREDPERAGTTAGRPGVEKLPPAPAAASGAVLARWSAHEAVFHSQHISFLENH